MGQRENYRDKFQAFSSVYPTGSVSMDLVKAFLRNSNLKQRNRQTLSSDSQVPCVVSQSQCPVSDVCLLQTQQVVKLS